MGGGVLAVMEVLAASTEVIAAMEDLVGIEDLVATEAIMVATEAIMAEAISTAVPASSSADTLGSPTTIRTVPILTPIITLTTLPILITTHLLIIRILPSLLPTSNRSQTPIGTTVRILKGITLTSQTVRVGGRGWFRLLPGREKKGGNMNWKPGLLVLFDGRGAERMCNDADRTDRHGDAQSGKAL